jgi:hypothetical protein
MYRMRLSSSMSWAEKREVVDNVIAILGLSHVQHSIVGDENNRGISGGVSIIALHSVFSIF